MSIISLIKDNTVPWKENEIIHVDKHVCLIADAFPLSKGHMLFVPVQNTPELIATCFDHAWKVGKQGVEENIWQGYNIGMNCGEVAGQTVNYPHVHLIPRYQNDVEEPRGGIRNFLQNKNIDYINHLKNKNNE